MNLTRNLMLGAVGMLAVSGTVKARQSFEVASIRLHVGPNLGVGISISGPRVTATNNSVRSLIMYAYNLKGYQFEGGPGWVSDYASYGWNVIAKAEGDGVLTNDQARKMMQALLADRFQLTFHREMKEMPVYTLVVAGKAGMKPDGKGYRRARRIPRPS
jgi:uncharacterized protein (TIGR03435 family)